MIRVYLMADFGKGPRVAARWKALPRDWEAKHLAWIVGPKAARAWWLVEAESADAARDVIALSAGQGIGERFGRILASGGAK